MNNRIHIPTEEEDKAALEEFFAREKLITKERRDACTAAAPALERLCKVMCERSGQPYKVRTVLFSLWNGKPAELNEVLGLDWEIRKDLVAVILAFGWEDKSTKFFYDALRAAVTKAGQWEWFIEECQNIKPLEEYVQSIKESQR